MFQFKDLHNQLRLRIPELPYETYDDAIRQSVDTICRKTSVATYSEQITTTPGQSSIMLNIPAQTVIHAGLRIVQPGASVRVIKPITNGLVVSPSDSESEGDYIRTFRVIPPNTIQIYPRPKDGGITLDIHVSLKPTKESTEFFHDALSDEYSEAVVMGALMYLHEVSGAMDISEIYQQRFKNLISSIHSDVIKQRADTPLKMSARF